MEYSIPSIDGKLYDKATGKARGYTDGKTKIIEDPKTLYDPHLWTDAKLEQALKEAIQNAADSNSGVLKREWSGETKEGFRIRGYFDNGKITSFYFE